MKVRFKDIDYHDGVIVLDCYGPRTLFLPFENVDRTELKISEEAATNPQQRRRRNNLEDHLYYVEVEGSLVKEIDKL